MYSPEHLCIHLLSSDFETVYNNTDPETAWLILRQIIFDIRCAIVPKVTSRNINLPVWFDSAVAKLCSFIKPSIAKIYKLTVLESKLQESIQISKQVYITNLLSSFNTKPGHLYRHLHRLIKPDLSPQFIIHNSTPIYNSDMCEIFNNYFHSTFTASDYTLPSIHELPSPPTQLSSINLDPFKSVQYLYFIVKFRSNKSLWQ